MYKNFSYISKINIRLDALLSSCLKISKNQAAKYCNKGLIFVDRKPRKSGYSVREKSEIVIDKKFEDIIPGNSQKNSKLNIKIAYEDNEIIILDKPIDIHCVRKSKDEAPTIADFLADYCPESISATNNTKESGLVNRLDFHTSGLILAAKSRVTAKKLKELQSKKQIEKTYIAIVGSEPKEKIISSGFIHNKNTVELANLETTYTTKITETSKLGEDLFTLEITGANFYRHQIRAHLASISSALIGDAQYNQDCIKKGVKTNTYFLHSKRIKFVLNGKKINVTSDRVVTGK